ncbi:MAG: zinc-ribbon domain-containing protein [Actinobacteria bacterium]|nr:zinc-ribbon domain-containing protein [Actinomycetota bacterium]
MPCSSCGAGVPADARFCPACGHALVAQPDQRRVAAVLFADLVGFTPLSEGADPERIKPLVGRGARGCGHPAARARQPARPRRRTSVPRDDRRLPQPARPGCGVDRRGTRPVPRDRRPAR